jgi:hypothetical protein
MDDGSPPPDLGFAPGNKKRGSESNGIADQDDVVEADSSLPHSAARRRRDLVSSCKESTVKSVVSSCCGGFCVEAVTWSEVIHNVNSQGMIFLDSSHHESCKHLTGCA